MEPNVLDKNREEQKSKVGFWYDVRAVSGSHAEVTVSIAGLSLALMLILPIFGGNVSRTTTPVMMNSLLFFFTSLVFGILSSFEYSVLSGDVRKEQDRIIAFLGPSVAFGVAVPTLFLGFIYVINAYLSNSASVLFALVIMRYFTMLALWASGTLVVRTAIGSLQFVEGRWQNERQYKGKIMVVLMGIYSVMALYSAVRMHYNLNTPGMLGKSKAYFYFMVVLAFLSILHYALFSFVGISVENERDRKGDKNGEKKDRAAKRENNFIKILTSQLSVKIFTGVLILSFIGFILWTFYEFI